MRILTIVTKRSVRETEKSRRFRLYYSSSDYVPGDVFELIDGNRKSPAIVLKSESADIHKQAIRSGNIEVHKIKHSKTGPYADGIVLGHYPMDSIRRYLKDSSLAHEQKDTFLSDFFPKKRRKTAVQKKAAASSDGSMSGLSMDRYQQQDKTHHSELQLFVDEVRNYFSEKARYGQGSFSYYLGICKKIPMTDLWQIYGEAKQARYKTRFEQKKLFWWKIGQYLKEVKK